MKMGMISVRMAVNKIWLPSKSDKLHIALCDPGKLVIAKSAIHGMESQDGMEAGNPDVCIERAPVLHIGSFFCPVEFKCP